MLTTLDTVLERISQTLKLIAAVGLILIALLIAADVIGRGAFNYPLIGVAELIANFLVIVAFMQLPYTVRIGGMLRSELFDTLAPRVLARAMWVLGYLLGALLFALIAHASWDDMIRAWVTGEFEGHASFRVPTFPVRLAIVVCSILGVINYLVLAGRAGIALMTGNEAPLQAITSGDVRHG
jgi:TRAP-type C4-dicarboxylate transport system permease small subunit